MALNTHALRFVKSLGQHTVTIGSTGDRAKVSIKGVDKFTFEAHVKVGAGSTSITDRMYVETQAGSDSKIRFACAPTRDRGRSVLIFEFARTDNTFATSYRYEIPNGWDDKWHHVAFSVDIGASRYVIFFDNVKVKEGTIVGGGNDIKNRALCVSDTIPQQIYIGACKLSTSGNPLNYWDGKVDTIRLFREFFSSSTYDSEDHPIYDHVTWTTAQAPTSLIEEWRFNEGPQGGLNRITLGVVDHQYDEKTQAQQNADSDNQNNNQEEEAPFSMGDPQYVTATIASENMWIGVDGREQINSNGVVILGKDFDRPYLGEGISDEITPSMPKNPTTSDVTESSFNVSWEPSVDNVYVQSYKVDVSTTASFSSTVYDKNVGLSLSHEITGLRPGVRYYWRVAASDANNKQSMWASPNAYRRFQSIPNSTRINYSPNPSFEGSNGGGKSYWEAYAETGTRPEVSVSQYLATSTSPPNTIDGYGEDYLVVSRSSSQSSVVGINTGVYHQLPWVSGNIMTCSFWAKGSGPLSVFAQYLSDYSVKQSTPLLTLKNMSSNVSATSHQLSSTWTRYAFTFTPSNVNMNNVRLFFVCSNTSPFTFNFDGILIENSSTVAPFFDGNSDDSYWVEFTTDSKATVLPNSGYIVETSSGIWQVTNESPSAKNITIYDFEVLQTKDFTDRSAPNAPTTDMNVTATYNSFVAKWLPPTQNYEDIVAYELQVGLKSNLSARDTVFLDGYNLLRIYDTSLVDGVYQREITGLNPTTNYYYRVRAVDQNGNLSDWSSAGKKVTTATRPDTTSPTAVVTEPAENVSFEGFTAKWNASSDDTGVVNYLLTVATNQEFTSIVTGYNEISVGNVLEYDVRGLLDNTTYYYRVAAKDAAENVSEYSYAGTQVKTNVRAEKEGGLSTEYLRLSSFAKVSKQTGETNTFYGEESTIVLDNNTHAVFQFDLNRQIPFGEITSASLNIKRTASTSNTMRFRITKLMPIIGDPTNRFYNPSSVSYSSITKSSQFKELEITQVNPLQGGVPISPYDVLILDITELLQGGLVSYGFLVEVLDNSVTIGGTENTNTQQVPEMSFTVDTSKTLEIAAATEVSKTKITRNLFPNPTLDKTSEEFVIPNGSFDLEGTSGWVFIPSPITGSEITFEKAEDISYDTVGGSGKVRINIPSAAANTKLFSATSNYKIPVVVSSVDTTYRFKMYVTTSNTQVTPTVFVTAVKTGGLPPETQYFDLTSFDPSPNIWYQIEKTYILAANTSNVDYLLVGVSAENKAAITTPLDLNIIFDSPSITSTNNISPLNALPIGSGVTVVKDSSASFDSGYLSSGSSILLTTGSGSADRGIRFVAESPNESWLTEYAENSTINLIEDPSFESYGEVYSNVNGPITYTGITSAVKTSISGARGINCLKVTTNVIDWSAQHNSPVLPTTYSPNLYRVAVGGTHNNVAYTVGQVLYHNGTSWVQKTSHTETIEIHTTSLPALEQELSHYFGSFYVRGQRKYRVEVVPIFSTSGASSNSNNIKTVVVGDDTWRRITEGVSSDGSSTSPFYTSVTYDSSDKLVRLKLVISVAYSTSSTLADYENSMSYLGNSWYIDGVQIERRASSSSYPSLYCDGFEDNCFWYGLPNQSISYRSCLVPSMKIATKQEMSLSGVSITTYLDLSDNSTTYSNKVIVPTIPNTKSGTWISVRGWPMQLLGVIPQVTYPIRSTIELKNTNAMTVNIDAVSLMYNDGTDIYFSGSSLNSSWSGEQFASISEHSGIALQSKIYTQGSGYDRARVISSIKAYSAPQMVVQTDESFYYKYNSSARSATVTIPEKFYWNRLSNSSFEQGTDFWDADASDITIAISPDAPSGSVVGRWKTSISVPQTSALFHAEPIRVYPDQMWSFQIQARPYNQQRSSNYKVRCGIAYYSDNNTYVGNIFANDYVHCYDYELLNNRWQTMFVQSIAPSGAYWARPFLANPPIEGGSTGLLAGEFIDFDAAMFYSGPALRQYFDGNENENFFWEGRQHRSPTVFVIRSNSEYLVNHSTADSVLFNIGNSKENIVKTALESADFVEFLFNDYQKRVGPNFIEISIPYRGQNTQRATLTSTSRRVDSYTRAPVSISIDEQKKIVVLRSEGLAQNREYVFEIDVVAPDTKRVRGDNKFVTSIVSGTRNEESLVSNEGDGTIEFGGFVLNGPKSKYYYVTEHDSFSLPERRNQIEIIPRSDGGVELQSYWGKKVISISGGVWGESRNHLYDNINALRAALSTKRQKLRIDTLANNNDYYWATCTSFNTQEVAGENIASLRWDAKFECADPFLYRGDEKISNFRILSSKPANTVDLFYTDDQTFTINNTGSIYSMPKLNVGVNQGQGEYSVAILNETTGERIVPKSIITLNDKINIDSLNQTVTKNGTINLDYVGTFPRLVPGANDLKVSIRDLKANRHNLLLNPGVELDTQVGISRSYVDASSTASVKQFHTGVTIERTKFQSASNSNYAALVSCDRLQRNQGVVFLTRTSMFSSEFSSNPTKSRQFSAAAYVKTDDSSAVELDKCFIRIWYTDGTKQDQSTTATQRYRVNSQWKLIKLPAITSSSKSIDYVEVLFLFSNSSRIANTFFIDNVYLIESTLSVDQSEASFDLSVSHQERFI